MQSGDACPVVLSATGSGALKPLVDTDPRPQTPCNPKLSCFLIHAASGIASHMFAAKFPEVQVPRQTTTSETWQEDTEATFSTTT